MDNVDIDQVDKKIAELVGMIKSTRNEDAVDECKRELAELVQPHVFKMTGPAESEIDREAVDMLGATNYSAYVDGSRVVLLIETGEGEDIKVPVSDFSHESE